MKHITELLDLVPALDAALVGMTAAQLKDEGSVDPDREARLLVAALNPVELREARATMLTAVYPAARVVAEQAYELGRSDQHARERRIVEEPDFAATVNVNPFAEDEVIL